MSHLPARSRRPIQFVLNLILWPIDSCQKRAPANQCHMTVSRAQVHNWLSWFVLKVLRCCFSIYRGFRSLFFFRRNSVCFSLTAKVESLQKDISYKIPQGLRFWPWLNLYIIYLQVFGVQYYGECWSGSADVAKYDKYGIAPPENCWEGVGEEWTNFVYKLV